MKIKIDNGGDSYRAKMQLRFHCPKAIFPDDIPLKYIRTLLHEVRHLQHEMKREKDL